MVHWVEIKLQGYCSLKMLNSEQFGAFGPDSVELFHRPRFEGDDHHNSSRQIRSPLRLLSI